MPKFFVKNNQIENNKITILGQDVNHIKNVLRLSLKDSINICDTDKEKNYECSIEEMQNEKIVCLIIKELESTAESNIDITIFQGLPKNDKMELIIQKSVELGANEIIPVSMKRCITKLDAKTEMKKINRWQLIAEGAAKQSGRDKIPEIKNVIDIKNICNIIENYDIVLVAYEEEKNNTLKQELKKIKSKDKKLKIGIVIGPEGGIEKEEINNLSESGAKIITLGDRILRTETVALAVTSIIMYEFNNFGGTI